MSILRHTVAAVFVALALAGCGGGEEQVTCSEPFVTIVHAAEGQRASFKVDAPRSSWFVWWITINGAVVAEGSARGGDVAAAVMPAGALVLQVSSADNSCGMPAVVIL